MSSSAGLLDFFILEAAEYVEHLDGLIAHAGSSQPDAAELTKYARALRGSATMARMTDLAELATAMERVGRAVRDGALRWDVRLQSAYVAAVDDVKLLLRNVRTWSADDAARARTRAIELAGLVPATMPSAASAAPAEAAAPGSGAARFLAVAATDITAALDALAARPEARTELVNVLNRVRALRGVAALKDLPPLADVVEGVERAAKPLELADAVPTAPQFTLFAAAAQVLRRAAEALAAGQRPDPDAPEVHRFADAAAALEDAIGDTDRVVPIASLYFADGGPHIVARAPNPPTTPGQRFRLEVVSQAEHLRRLAADARDARDEAARSRLARELSAALRALSSAAASFGEQEVVAFVDRVTPLVVARDASAFAALDAAAVLLADGRMGRADMVRRLGELPMASAAPEPAAVAPRSATPLGVPTFRPRSATPSGAQLHAILESGIVGISRLDQTPLSSPTVLPEAMPLVPIETLLYRGPSALQRAREVRDTVRSAMRAGSAPDSDALDELFDLLDLAAVAE